jgi:hypothetical protein
VLDDYFKRQLMHGKGVNGRHSPHRLDKEVCFTFEFTCCSPCLLGTGGRVELLALAQRLPPGQPHPLSAPPRLHLIHHHCGQHRHDPLLRGCVSGRGERRRA